MARDDPLYAITITAIVGTVLAGPTGVLSRERAPLRANDAEVRQCVANLQASLHGRSILGSRDTAAYIQKLGWLESRLGVTEYDLMVDRCRTELFHRNTTARRKSAADR